jgi:hydroxymethylpyrimidine pyrophosphatase-like HAD family hydrolase
MSRIALVVSDIDGMLLTTRKTLTDAAIAAVRRLHEARIGFTVTSSRPTMGMRFLVEPLAIALPIGAFNGSSIVDSNLNPIEQHLIPAAAAERSIRVLNDFGVDIWLFTNDTWLTRRADGEYVPLEKRAIHADPTIVPDLRPISRPPARSSDRAPIQHCCNVAKRQCMKLSVGTRPQFAHNPTIST